VRIPGPLPGAGIYLWTHKQSGKMYVGSAIDLSIRLSKYYLPSALKQVDNYISRAIICHTHSAFSLSILEYIDISNLSKDKAKALILGQEQYYIDSLMPEYNILKIAGNSLGYKHSLETLIKMSGENHPMFGRTGPNLGKTLSTETLALMSLAKSGENHPMYGRTHSTETKALMSAAKLGENHPLFSKGHTAETKAKMSAAKGTAIFVYSSDGKSLINTFSSANQAAKHFKCNKNTVLRYARNNLIFKEQWFFSTSLITKEEENS
jgi:hypothetical protein